jgi:hypothetical protein
MSLFQDGPIYLTEYLSPRLFVLYDATPVYGQNCSGGALLFRSMGGLFEGASIDLFFSGIHYFELPSELRGVRITKPRDDVALLCEEDYDPYSSAKRGDRAYAIKSEGKRYYVISSYFSIHIHTKPLLETSLSSLCSDDLKTREAFFNEFVREWYKVD